MTLMYVGLDVRIEGGETKTIDPELEQSCQLYGKEKGSLFYKT